MLSSVDLNKTLSEAEYEEQLLDLQLEMRQLALRLYTDKRSLIVTYEGWDAAGKGGSIRRLTSHIDPRGYHIYSIAAPQGDDKTHHYLWRFWRRLIPPDEKQITVFDRSWYGRVLVERVEGFAAPGEWKRAYREINDFERQLTDAGIMLVKFWLHISQEEQLSRFEARKQTPYNEVQAHRRRLAEPRQVARVHPGGRRHASEDRQSQRTLDGPRSQLQAIRTGKGAADHRRHGHRGARDRALALAARRDLLGCNQAVRG